MVLFQATNEPGFNAHMNGGIPYTALKDDLAMFLLLWCRRYGCVLSSGECQPPLKLRDGHSFRVQVGETSYCMPKDNQGPWLTVQLSEVSFTDHSVLLTMADDPSSYETSLYSYVPASLVMEVMRNHGGPSLCSYAKVCDMRGAWSLTSRGRRRVRMV